MAEGGDLGLDSADGREAVGAVPGSALQPQRAIGIVAHVILVHARHRRTHIMPEYPRLRTFPCMNAHIARMHIIRLSGDASAVVLRELGIVAIGHFPYGASSLYKAGSPSYSPLLKLMMVPGDAF